VFSSCISFLALRLWFAFLFVFVSKHSSDDDLLAKTKQNKTKQNKTE